MDVGNEGLLDRLIGILDTGLKTVTGQGPVSNMPEVASEELSKGEKEKSAALMRVNHSGEVCAQGLYEGQALVSRTASLRVELLAAAEEEKNHLLWCNERLDELQESPSVLVPVFYGMSVCVGALVGLAGDRISQGFVEATEDQVCEHLDRHLEEMSVKDGRSRAILKQIRNDEKRHGQKALQRGGVQFAPVVKRGMTLMSRLMTETTRHI